MSVFTLDEEMCTTPRCTVKRPVRRVPVIIELQDLYRRKAAYQSSHAPLETKKVDVENPAKQSALHEEVVREGLVQPGVVVQTLYQYLFGEEIPMQDLDWLCNMSSLEAAIKTRWPQGNTAYILLQVALWLAEMHATTLSDRVYTHLYDKRMSFVR